MLFFLRKPGILGNFLGIACIRGPRIFIFTFMFSKAMHELFQRELGLLLPEKKGILVNDIPGFSTLLEKVLDVDGKSVRSKVMMAFAQRDGDAPAELRFYASCLELLHLASLIQDDVLDDADLRRGHPTFHKLLGKKNAVLTGDFLCVRVLRELEKKGELPMLREFLTYSNELVEGEIFQTLCAGKTGLSEEDYLRIIEKKTGSLFVMAAAVGARLASCDEPQIIRARRFGRLFGSAFQILDDVVDLTGQAESQGKTALLDLKNGVMTLPLIYFIQEGGDIERLKALGREGLWSEVLALLNACDGLERAIAIARGNLDAALAEVQGCFAEETSVMLRGLGADLLDRIKEGALYGV
jgi:octaprenyl-diphosphate synthase